MKANVFAFVAAIAVGKTVAYNFTTGELYENPQGLAPFGNIHKQTFEDMADYPQHVADCVKSFTRAKSSLLMDNEDRFVTASFDGDNLVMDVQARVSTTTGVIPKGVGF